MCAHEHFNLTISSFCYSSQAKAKTEGTSFTVLQDGDHQSPGSVLEASFSNDSFCSSLDDRSGKKFGSP